MENLLTLAAKIPTEAAAWKYLEKRRWQGKPVCPHCGVIDGHYLLRAKGNDLIVFQILDPAELTFPFDRPANFQDLESGERIPLVPEQLQAIPLLPTRREGRVRGGAPTPSLSSSYPDPLL